ncbi:NAD(P)/FAD-dependent oxidoreductase [Nocardia vaccinii]|uniref:NAD(P)/FAD-dependent oxidoreductase n=1 Tax=Nocardia vaccinii TaxID=1822 RepID=UPI0014712FE8|nr:FAD-dependent oxidoreductase [Nocardia vaccinii]
MDIAVVGNGVLGLSIAVEIARRAPKIKIAVIGPPGRTLAASMAAGAMLNCFAEVTKYTHQHPAAEAKFAIARQALDEWPAWLDRLCDDVGDDAAALRTSRTGGTFVLLSSRSGHIAQDNFQAMRTALIEYNEPHEQVDPQDIEGLEPSPGARPSQAVHLHREGAIDARAVLAALEAAARRHGVHIVPTTVQALLADADTVAGVQFADGSTLSAGTVILAAGSTSSALADSVLPPGETPPMLHGNGLALLTQRTAPHTAREVLRTPIRAGSCGLHLVPLAGEGRQYLGANNMVTLDPAHGPGLGDCQAFLYQMCEQIDQKIASSHITHWLHGARPMPLDCFPMIGESSLRGLHFATGTYRDGFHCSPVIARHVTDTVLNQVTTNPGFDWFTPKRPPIQTMTVEEAIAEFTAHEVDGSYEYGLSLPFWLDSETVAQHSKQRARRVHEQLDELVALPPDIVMPLQGLTASDGLADLRLYLHAARAYHQKPAQATVV